MYNYFATKAELVAAAIESIWSEIFRLPAQPSFARYVQTLFERIEWGCKEYPGFFVLHATGFLEQDKSEAKALMQHAWQQIHNALAAALASDCEVRADAFSQTFTSQQLCDVVFSMLLAAMLQEHYEASATLEVINRVLY